MDSSRSCLVTEIFSNASARLWICAPLPMIRKVRTRSAFNIAFIMTACHILATVRIIIVAAVNKMIILIHPNNETLYYEGLAQDLKIPYPGVTFLPRNSFLLLDDMRKA